MIDIFCPIVLDRSSSCGVIKTGRKKPCVWFRRSRFPWNLFQVYFPKIVLSLPVLNNLFFLQNRILLELHTSKWRVIFPNFLLRKPAFPKRNGNIPIILSKIVIILWIALFVSRYLHHLISKIRVSKLNFTPFTLILA